MAATFCTLVFRLDCEVEESVGTLHLPPNYTWGGKLLNMAGRQWMQSVLLLRKSDMIIQYVRASPSHRPWSPRRLQHVYEEMPVVASKVSTPSLSGWVASFCVETRRAATLHPRNEYTQQRVHPGAFV